MTKIDMYVRAGEMWKKKKNQVLGIYGCLVPNVSLATM